MSILLYEFYSLTTKLNVENCIWIHLYIFIISGNNLNVHQRMNVLRRCGTYVQRNTTQP